MCKGAISTTFFTLKPTSLINVFIQQYEGGWLQNRSANFHPSLSIKSAHTVACSEGSTQQQNSENAGIETTCANKLFNAAQPSKVQSHRVGMRRIHDQTPDQTTKHMRITLKCRFLVCLASYTAAAARSDGYL